MPATQKSIRQDALCVSPKGKASQRKITDPVFKNAIHTVAIFSGKPVFRNPLNPSLKGTHYSAEIEPRTFTYFGYAPHLCSISSALHHALSKLQKYLYMPQQIISLKGLIFHSDLVSIWRYYCKRFSYAPVALLKS